MSIISNFNKNMKIVKESLLEFHQTGDPLGTLNIGKYIHTTHVISKNNPYYGYAGKIIHIRSKKDIDDFQEKLDSKNYKGLVISFEDPETHIMHAHMIFEDFINLYGDRYNLIKYYGYYFKF